ncbi:hypothetical protein [Hyalangium versicolor]|uniref:hypothetical protein n=1 Tax=Hyalangium versicolor TaxID=2861190 RepID=UPI001CCE3F9B|nr:hypothetical protein [Hyalangium versicolor]
MFRDRPWLLFLVALVLAGACRCDDPGVGGAKGDFRAQETELNFGRVLEGQQARRTVTLVGTGRAGVTVKAATDSPFSVAEDSVAVPGGGTATLEVVFTAGDAPAEGTLVLTAGSHTENIALKGVGVRPLACVPSEQCRESHFEVEPGQCVETLAPDGIVCIPTSKCEEQGRCQQGVCVGSPRLCDDDNPCTEDACSPTEGCVTAPVVCPRPSNPCKVGVCEPSSGCGEADAPDFSLCGGADCKTANVCVSGSCRTVPTPEGFFCAPATPCQGEGKCHDGECVRPDAGDLPVLFSQKLGGVPAADPGGPVLLVQDQTLYTSVCGDDAGCRLVAFTDKGLLRFEAPYEDGGPRTLLTVSDGGILLHEPQALESYALAGPGQRLWQAPLGGEAAQDGGRVPSTGVGRVALTAEGEVVALVSWRPPENDGGLEDGGMDGGTPEDAGTISWPATLMVLGTDGGVLRAGSLEGFSGEGARVSLEEQGTLLVCSEEAERVSRVEPEPEDAGVGFVAFPLVDEPGDAGSSLAVAGGRLFAGARLFASTDGGSRVQVPWDGGMQSLTPIAEPALLLDDVGYAFARTCPDGGAPCPHELERLMLRALDARTGATAWEVSVLPEDAPGTLYEASLVQGGAVGTLTDVELDGGPRVHVQFFSGGERIAVCPLRDRPRVAGAAHVGRYLYVVLEREGTWRLEAFDLGSLGLAETRGWPQRNGISGTRRARP